MDTPAIRAGRELLAELAWMNSDVTPLAMRIIENSATFAEQRTFADRLINLGTRLSHRVHQTGVIIDGDISTAGQTNRVGSREQYARGTPAGNA